MIRKNIQQIEQEQATPSAKSQPEGEKDLLQFFGLLGQKTRLRIMLYLQREGELDVTALTRRLKERQPLVSHHLAQLREAGLIEVRCAGRHHLYSICSTQMSRIFQEVQRDFFEDDEDPDGLGLGHDWARQGPAKMS